MSSPSEKRDNMWVTLKMKMLLCRKMRRKKGRGGEEKRGCQGGHSVSQSVATPLSVGAPGPQHEALTWNSK